MRSLVKIIGILSIFFSMVMESYSQTIDYQKIVTTFTFIRKGDAMKKEERKDISSFFFPQADSLYEDRIMEFKNGMPKLDYFLRYKRISDDTIQVFLLRDDPSTKRYLIVQGGKIGFSPRNLENALCAPTLHGCRISPTRYSRYRFSYMYNDSVIYTKMGSFPLKRRIFLRYTGTDSKQHSHQLSSPVRLDSVPMDISKPISFDVCVPRETRERTRSTSAESYQGSMKIVSHTISFYGVDTFKTSLEPRYEGALLCDISKLRYLQKSKVVQSLGVELFVEEADGEVERRMVCILPKINIYDPSDEKKKKGANRKK